MENAALELLLAHAWTMSCAVVGSLMICCAYWFSTEPGKRVSWLPLVLVLLGVITALVISVIKGSIALSLGLIGALSIARFRTRINDPRQLALVLVSIAIGVGCGAGELMLTAVGAVFMAGLITIFYSPSFWDPVISTAPMVVAQFTLKGRSPVAVDALSDYLDTRHPHFQVRNISRTDEATTIKVHLQDCSLAYADQLARGLNDVFPSHACAWELQLKSMTVADEMDNASAAKGKRSRQASSGVSVAGDVFGGRAH